MSKNIKFLFFLGLLFIFPSCIIVKEKVFTEQELSSEFSLLPAPQVPISDVSIRSPRGDMIAFLPENWFFIDTEEKAPSTIFSIAVNSNYTLCLVFSRLTNKINVGQILKESGPVGLAMKSFELKSSKSLHRLRLIGNIENLKNSYQKFFVYKYINTSKSTVGKSAVFITPLNEVYEYSLFQLDFRMKEPISDEEFDKIFLSVLATIKY
ncbi:MAG: hypothetical protein N2517_00695 [Ignavibacteria bacterium]|nr:hypothetical protein [Ignavibacteria bacterium]